MPALGTFKCRQCSEFKRRACDFATGALCAECCAGKYCHSIKCGQCNKHYSKCSSCISCMNHAECCGCMSCVVCTALVGRYRWPHGCQAKERICLACHVSQEPQCKHCIVCLVKCEPEECCDKCQACCLSASCPRRVTVRMFDFKNIMPIAVCKKCGDRKYEAMQYGADAIKHRCRQCLSLLSTRPETMPLPVLSRSFSMNPLKRLIGLEIEASKYLNGKKVGVAVAANGGSIVPDGSVPSGFEINTAPSNGDAFCSSVFEICNALKESKATADHKAGLHVHVDFSDAKYVDLRRLVILYAKTEDALYNIIDRRRINASNQAGNGYCKKYGPGLLEMMLFNDWRQNLIRLVFGSPRDGAPGAKQSKAPLSSDRYMGLNLVSWWARKTIEFRMHHGTTKPEKMIGWALLMAGMCESAVRRTDREIESWPKGLRGMLEYAPTDSVKMWAQQRWDYFQGAREKRSLPPSG